MNRIVFLAVLFLPFFFFTYLFLKRLTLSYIGKKVLDYGLVASCAISFLASVIQYFLDFSAISLFLIIANLIFLFLSIISSLFFKFKKQFMFTQVRYNLFLSLLISTTYLYILSENLILSLLFWILSGMLIYFFSYFDIFKTTSDYDSSRFYSIFLGGDFCFLIACILLIKFAILSNNYSYLLNFEEIKQILNYVLGNGDLEYIIIPVLLLAALFSRSFIFPFSCFFSFLTNASNMLYLCIYTIISPLYALILFLKLDIFSSVNHNFKIYLLASIFISLFSLLFEKHFKIIFGYILSVINASFIILYFYNAPVAYLIYIISLSIAVITLSILFLGKKLSFRRRPININKGFIQEKCFILLTESLPCFLAGTLQFISEKILKNFFGVFIGFFEFISYHYIIFVQKRKITSILKGILIIFALFALLAIFIALFGNFGEMQ